MFARGVLITKSPPDRLIIYEYQDTGGVYCMVYTLCDDGVHKRIALAEALFPDTVEGEYVFHIGDIPLQVLQKVESRR